MQANSGGSSKLENLDHLVFHELCVKLFSWAEMKVGADGVCSCNTKWYKFYIPLPGWLWKERNISRGSRLFGRHRGLGSIEKSGVVGNDAMGQKWKLPSLSCGRNLRVEPMHKSPNIKASLLYHLRKPIVWRPGGKYK